MKMDVCELREAMLAELAMRRVDGRQDSYADRPGEVESLYGLTGAVHVMAAVSRLPDRSMRDRLARRINERWAAMEDAAASSHALCMAISALRLLGADLEASPRALAPVDATALPAWLDGLDWSTTHKELYGSVVPLLAGGRLDQRWVRTFADRVGGRLNPDRPLETWCAADAPAWRVVSSVYHVLTVYDAGRIPYPQPHMLMDRLMGLRWHEAADDEPRTACTDADLAWMFLHLCEVMPERMPQALAVIRALSQKRIAAWHNGRGAILAESTHHLYCCLWGTAVFQDCVRDDYIGPYLRDTLNDPGLFAI